MAIGTILNITPAGVERETQVFTENKPIDVVGFVVDDGESFPGYKGDHVINEARVIPVTVINKVKGKEGVVFFEVTIEADYSIHARGFGLKLSDGTIYAYSRFSPETDGMLLPEGVAMTFKLLLARVAKVDFNFSYSVVDVAATAKDIEDLVRGNLDLYLEGYLIGMTEMISGLNDRLINQQKQLNQSSMIDGKLILEVGIRKQFSTIQSAFDSLKGRQIKGQVVIKVADGDYDVPTIFLANHPYASKIIIEGNFVSPEKCTLRLNKSSYGIVIRGLYGLTFGGFKIVGQDSNPRCIRLDTKSFVVIPKGTLIIEGGRNGIEIDNSRAEMAGLKIYGVKSIGCLVNALATAYLHSLEILGRGIGSGIGLLIADGSKCYAYKSNIKKLNIGIQVTRLSSLQFDRSVVRESNIGIKSEFNAIAWGYINGGIPLKAIACGTGFLAENSGQLQLVGAIAESCRKGFVARKSSMISCVRSSAILCNDGYEAWFSSSIEAYGSSKSTAAKSLYMPKENGVAGNVNSIIVWS